MGGSSQYRTERDCLSAGGKWTKLTQKCSIGSR
jgi:hypothetical protein